MLPSNIYSIDFSVDTWGEIEDISMSSNDVVTEKDIEDLIKKVVDNHQLIIGERCEGSIEIDETIITFDYKYCSELGEDWGDDVWEDEILTIPND